jgi:hypothetical protein
MKLYQKAITLVVLLVMVLASFGMIAFTQVNQSPVAAQSISLSVQANGAPALNQIQMAGLKKPNVSWNS